MDKLLETLLSEYGIVVAMLVAAVVWVDQLRRGERQERLDNLAKFADIFDKYSDNDEKMRQAVHSLGASLASLLERRKR